MSARVVRCPLSAILATRCLRRMETHTRDLPSERASVRGCAVVPDLIISVRRVGNVEVPLPKYQTEGAAGLDLHAALELPITIGPLGRAKVPTGLVVAI